jgi:hypothetical protein
VLNAIGALPPIRKVEHCSTSFLAPVFAMYGNCPDCDAQVKMRSFSGELEVEDVFDAVFEWMSSTEGSLAASRRIAQINDDVN